VSRLPAAADEERAALRAELERIRSRIQDPDDAAEALIEGLHAVLTAKWAGLGDPGLAEMEALAEGIRLLRFRFGCRSADFLFPVREGGDV
jgi:hypothetical protein